MNFFFQIRKHFLQIQNGGLTVLFKKIFNLTLILFNSTFYIIAFFLLIIIRIISPFYLIIWTELVSSRIGHFAKEPAIITLDNVAGINVPTQKYLDIFFFRK